MSLYLKFINNVSKPKGFLGKLMLSMMNSGHTKVSLWGLGHLDPHGDYKNIADIGCGGGKNVQRLLAMYPKAHVVGIDYSEESVSKTRQLNKNACAAHRAYVTQQDVSNLDLKDESFDLVCAFETIYFWPGPSESYKEVYRVLDDNGTFLIVLEITGESPDVSKWEKQIDGMKAYTQEQIIHDLLAVGFKDIQTFKKEGTDWFSLIAKK